MSSRCTTIHRTLHILQEGAWCFLPPWSPSSASPLSHQLCFTRGALQLQPNLHQLSLPQCRAVPHGWEVSRSLQTWEKPGSWLSLTHETKPHQNCGCLPGSSSAALLPLRVWGCTPSFRGGGGCSCQVVPDKHLPEEHPLTAMLGHCISDAVTSVPWTQGKGAEQR